MASACRAAPGWASNLQDHLDICTLQHSTQRVTYDRASELKTAFDYFLRGHRGPGSSNIAEAGGFVRSPLAPDERADIQLHFVPAMLDDHGRNRLQGDGYTLHACFLRPRSRGRITWPAPTRAWTRASKRITSAMRKAST
jgi:choline dehydrogenase